jgi:hypothetical protein
MEDVDFLLSTWCVPAFFKIYLAFFYIYVEMRFTSAAAFTAAMESFIKVFRHYSVISVSFELGFWQKYCVRMIGQHLRSSQIILIFFSLPVFRIRDPVPFWSLDPGSGMGKQSGSGSGMNNPDHLSESLETIFWIKILKFFDADPGSGMGKIRIRERKKRDPGSGLNIPDPQHCSLP